MQEIIELKSSIGKLTETVSGSLHNLSTEQHVLADRILQLEQKGSQGYMDAPRPRSETLATKLCRSDEAKQLIERRTAKVGMPLKIQDLIGLESKAALVSSEAITPPMRAQGIVAAPMRRNWLYEQMPIQRVNSGSIEYSREVAFTNNAAPQGAEGTQKAESGITFELVTETAVTVAHWVKVSKQALSDNGGLAPHVDGRLRYGLQLELDSQVLNGSGVSGNMNGLLKTGNFTAYDTSLGVVGDTAIDILRHAKQQLELTDFQPDTIILNPTDLAAIELIKDADGNFIVGNPVSGQQPTLWGLPVFASNDMAAGSFVVAALAQSAQLWVREDATVLMSDSDGDNFTKNLVTILAEMRAAVSVFRPAGIIKGAFA